MDTCSDVVRQKSRKNKYNPEGLSLIAIDLELSGAFGPQDNPDQLTRHLLEEMISSTRAHREQCQQSGKVHVCQVLPGGRESSIETESVNSSIDPTYFDRMLALPVASHLIKATDGNLAALIKDCPFSLLRSLAVQDALARWTYAAHHYHDKFIRDQARAHISASLPKQEGNPGKAPADPRKLLAAYDDLCSYCKCIIAAANAGLTKVDVESQFPDSNKLTYNNDTILERIFDPKHTKPAPSEWAASYIAKQIGLSSQRIMDLISNARAAIRH